jgi:RND superfamily putative drug exporter
MSDGFAKDTGTEAAVGGNGGAFGDFTSEGSDAIWPVVIGETVVILLLLIVLLRSVVLPAVAVPFDLLTAAATFGILSLLYSGDDPLLGAPGYIDPISIIGIFAFVFGVSMVYEVVLLHRTREAFLATGDAHGAVRTGLQDTAAAATGAAAVMLAAIILDALIVRPVLLPAAASLLGRWSWWPLSRQAPPTPPPAPKTPAARPAPAGGLPAGA